MADGINCCFCLNILTTYNTIIACCSCFLSHLGAFWGAFLVPIFTIMIFNIIIFICVIVVLVRHIRDTAARQNKSVEKKTILRLMFSISGVMFLFGLTWLFAILTFSVPGLREAGITLFTIFNSLQGFFIFIFFCVVNEDARKSWKELFSRGTIVYKYLHSFGESFKSGEISAQKNVSSDTSKTELSIWNDNIDQGKTIMIVVTCVTIMSN